MRAILTFNLPRDRAEFDLANKAGQYKSALWDVAAKIREKTKYGDEKTSAKWEEFREAFWAIMNEAGVDPYED